MYAISPSRAAVAIMLILVAIAAVSLAARSSLLSATTFPLLMPTTAMSQ